MDWKMIVVEPIKAVLTRVGAFIPTLIGVLLILIVGWLIAKLIQKGITRVLRLVRLDIAAEKSGITSILTKGGIKYSLAELIAVLAYWLILLGVFMAAVNALGLTIAAELLNRVISYVPHVIASIFILVLGMFFAGLVGSIVRTATSNVGIGQAKLLGQITQVVIVIFASVMALGQLNIGTTIITFAFNIVLGAIGLAAALAFGLGCKDIAGRLFAEMLKKVKAKR